MNEIPSDHPRAESLRVRHAIIDGMHKKVVAEAGLIAHGRGEAFDYLLGEKTHKFSLDAIDAAAAMLYLAKHPILSVNGNVTVLCPEAMIEFSKVSKIPLEINIFYRSDERLKSISKVFQEFDLDTLLGLDPKYSEEIDEISSLRRVVDRRGIYKADVVFVPLEDGDRTIGLKKNNKNVITVDLNPLSRTSREADITIVDNIIRVFPLLQKSFLNIKNEEMAKVILSKYDNATILKNAMEEITRNFREQLANI